MEYEIIKQYYEYFHNIKDYKEIVKKYELFASLRDYRTKSKCIYLLLMFSMLPKYAGQYSLGSTQKRTDKSTELSPKLVT